MFACNIYLRLLLAAIWRNTNRLRQRVVCFHYFSSPFANLSLLAWIDIIIT